LGVPLLVGVAWLAVRRLGPVATPLPDRDTIESESRRLVVPLVLSYTVPLIVVVLLTGVALVATVLSFLILALVPAQETLLRVMGAAGQSDVQFGWQVVVSLVSIAVAVRLARRGQQAGALFLGILGLLYLKSRLQQEGRPLEMLAAVGPGDRTDLWWVLLFAALALYWLVRRQLTAERASGLAFLTLITLLLRQTDFISNRFSPFADSSGLGFLAFGIVWDALTIGAWANEGSRGLPRISRIFLYLGYVLLTVTVINWAVASHDLGAVSQLTGELGLVGLDAFGKPLLYTIFVVTLVGAFRADRPGEVVEPEPPPLDDDLERGRLR
jgi:hypothetical protein